MLQRRQFEAAGLRRRALKDLNLGISFEHMGFQVVVRTLETPLLLGTRSYWLGWRRSLLGWRPLLL